MTSWVFFQYVETRRAKTNWKCMKSADILFAQRRIGLFKFIKDAQRQRVVAGHITGNNYGLFKQLLFSRRRL